MVNCSLVFFFPSSGLNLARMLGDKFLKQQDPRFSSEPYISQVVRIDRASGAFALLAR
jgi:protein phosphatase